MPLSLDDAVSRALAHNLQVRLGEQNQQLVRGEVLSVENNLLPSLQAQAYTRSAEINLAAQGFKPAVFQQITQNLGSAGTLPTIVKVNTTSAQVSLNQTIFNVPAFFLYRAAKKADSAAELGTLNIRGGVALQMASGYLRALADRAEIENARSLLRADEVALQQAVESHRAGVATNLDELRARVQLQSEQQTLISAENTFSKDKIALNRVMGLPAEQDLTLTDAVPYAELAEMPLPLAMELAFVKRKDLLTLEAQVVVAEATLKAVKYQRLPTLGVNGFYGVLGETRGLYHGVFTAEGSMKFPIFREAEFRGEQEVADAQLRGLQIQITALRVTIEAQIRSSMLDVESANQLVKVAQNNVDLAQQELNDAQERFSAGVTDNLPLVEAQATLAGAQSRLVEVTYQYNAAKLNLARNTGVIETQYKVYLGR